MKNIPNPAKLITGSLAVAALLYLPVSTPAAPITLSVNSSLSSLTLSGGVAGLGFVAAPAGSLVDFWGGTITADLTGGVITFSGGSSINALLNPVAPLAPPIGGGITGGVDNYGGFASGNVAALGGATTVNGAWRDLVLDITLGAVQNGVAPGTGVKFKYLAGSKLEYYVTSPGLTGPGVSDLSTVAAASDTALGLVAWDGTTLNLPVKFTMTGGNGLIEVWQGNIVATVVPEPSSVALALVGLGLFAARRARTSSSLVR